MENLYRASLAALFALAAPAAVQSQASWTNRAILSTRTSGEAPVEGSERR